MAILSAVFASAGVALPPATFTAPEADEDTTTISSTPDGTGVAAHHVLDIPGNAPITCGQANVHGEAKGASFSPLAVSVSYASCFPGSAVHMNGCTYTLAAAGTLTIDCPAGEEITFEWTELPCQYHIPPQGPLSGVAYTNVKPGAMDEITVSLSVKGIKGTATGTHCFSPGPFTEGRFTTAATILMGTRSGSAVPLQWDATEA